LFINTQEPVELLPDGKPLLRAKDDSGMFVLTAES
jgi:hypothetical protein